MVNATAKTELISHGWEVNKILAETVVQVGCIKATGYLALVRRPDILEMYYIEYWISGFDFNKILAETEVQVGYQICRIFSPCA